MNDTQEVFIGIVTTYDAFKGFGFIRRDKGRDVFFHFMDIADEKEPTAGDKVKFQVEKTKRGPKAIHLKLIDAESIYAD